MISARTGAGDNARALQSATSNPEAGATSMFRKTIIALLAALALNAAYVSAQAQTGGRGCVSSTMEEGTLSAYPAWQVC
jgi:hypothetical protein